MCDTARVEVQVSRRSDCRNEDNDDHDHDGDRDDHDHDDDNDGHHDDDDDDDDNDGHHDNNDDDDDNDGIHDDFDDESSQQTQSSRADEAEAGGVVTYQVTADVNTLLLAVVVQGPGSFVIEIYNPQGLRVAQGVSVRWPRGGGRADPRPGQLHGQGVEHGSGGDAASAPPAFSAGTGRHCPDVGEG